jgi:hypothetical protein
MTEPCEHCHFHEPEGAVLTGPQTLVLAKMLNGLCNLLLAEFGSTTGA